MTINLNMDDQQGHRTSEQIWGYLLDWYQTQQSIDGGNNVDILHGLLCVKEDALRGWLVTADDCVIKRISLLARAALVEVERRHALTARTTGSTPVRNL